MTNKERSNRFGKLLVAIDHLYDTRVEHEAIVDLLADAMHWCDADGDDFHLCLMQAGRHYVHELNDQQHDERRMQP
jgi:hypothetical protein